MISPDLKQKLIEEAKKALANPYPKDRAGEVYSAAVLTDAGNIYSAANYYSDAYSLILHGEQSALAHAAAHGEGVIVAIAITSNKEHEKGVFSNPCHICKQLLWESRLRSGVPLLIILANNHGEVTEVDLDEIITLPWPAKC